MRTSTDTFIEELVTLTKQLKQGDPLEPSTDVGAMVNEQQLNFVKKRVEEAIEEGATVLTGGQRNPGHAGFEFVKIYLHSIKSFTVDISTH